MIEEFGIQWKVAGYLPIPIAEDCIYYRQCEDLNYAKRTFGRSDLRVSTSTLEPTKLFHQALAAELTNKYNLNISAKSLPYVLPIEKLDSPKINFRLRVFSSRFLVLSIHIPHIFRGLSVSEIIKLQMLSSHQPLEAVARFFFNVHYSPNPSQVDVRAWLSKPILKIIDHNKNIDKSSLVEILTRHQGINERAVKEILEKNERINFNDDILLIDKQGIVFLYSAYENDNKRNRYNRISQLFEYAMYVKSFETYLSEREDLSIQEIQKEAESINAILGSEVLHQSVSAHRGWGLLKKEMSLKAIDLHSSLKDQNLIKYKDVVPYYRHPIFKGISTLIALIAGSLTIYQIIKSLWF